MFGVVFLFACVRGTSLHVIGDWGRNGQFSQREVAKKMQSIPHNAVISVGDNFYPDGLANSNDPAVKTSWSDIYNTSIPWYVALGNHDYHGNATAQMHIQHPSWNMPSQNHIFNIGDHSFVLLDSQKFNYTKVDQLLSKASRKYKWMVAHHPIYSAGWHNKVETTYRDNVIELYNKYGCLALLSGHDHNLQYIEVDGLRQIISGAGSSTYRWQVQQDGLEFFNSIPGFVNLILSDKTVSIQFLSAKKIEFEVVINILTV